MQLVAALELGFKNTLGFAEAKVLQVHFVIFLSFLLHLWLDYTGHLNVTKHEFSIHKSLCGSAKEYL